MRRLVAIAGTAVVALLILAGAALAFHDAIAAAVIRTVVAGAGYDVAFARLQVGLGGATATDTTVTNRAGAPVFRASRIELHYVLRDLLPGAARRRFGISALDIERPVVTLIHAADGSYNVTLPSGSTTAKPDTTPIDVRVRVRDGAVELIDRYTDPRHERRERIVGFAADAVLAPHVHSFYTVHFALDDGRTLHPVDGKATFAADRGFEAQRWTAADLPIGPLVDFALSSHAVNVADGDLRDVDGRVYAFVDPDGTAHAHLGLHARLTNGTVFVAGLAAPLRDAHGTLTGYDDGLTTTGLEGTLAGVPLHVAGGVFDLAAPKVRFALTGAGDLGQLQQAIAAAQRQPVSGRLSFGLEALGPLSAPIVSGAFSSPQLVYRGFPLEAPSGAFAIAGRELQILDARARYGPVDAEAHGTLELERKVRTDIVVSLHGAGDRLPYVSQLLRGLQFAGVVHVAGTGTQLASSGIVYGDARDGRLNGLFHVDGGGSGVVGPLDLERSDGASLYVRAALDRTRATATGIVDAHRFSLLQATAATLPGLHVATLPAVRGTLDAQLAGGVDAGRLDALAGRVRLATTFGSLDGRATSDGGLAGFSGRVHSSFEALRPLDRSLTARGPIDGTIAALTNGATTAVAGEASLAGGVVTVQGRLTAGGAAELTATTSPLALRALAGAGIPVDGGTVMADVHASGNAAAPRAEIALLVDGARWRGGTYSGNAAARYAGGTVHLDGATALAFGAYATAGGDVRGIGGARPTLDLTADVHGAQLAPLSRALRLPLRYPDGEVDANVHATGAAAAPHVTGSVRIPQGSLNGLDFAGAQVTLDASPSALAARDGRITVGSTSVAFSGELTPAEGRVSLHAPHLDLADFNDYFDTADTLGGTGRLLVDASRTGAGVTASGALTIDGARYRRFVAGDIDAAWHTSGRTLTGTGSVRSAYGTAMLAANATFPAADPLRDTAHRTAIAANGNLTGFDLAHWLPVAGVTLPVRGIVDGAARASGTLAAPSFALTAALRDGVAGPYTVNALTVAATGDPRGAHVTALHFDGPGLSADASGTFGYGAHDPIALALTARSDDISLLAKSFGANVDAGGGFTTTIDAGGTRAVPRLTQTVDATNLRSGKYVIPRAHAELTADSAIVQLRTLDAQFARGRLLANATVPITLQPAPAIRNAPLTASLRASGIDLAQFAALLPGNAKLGGTLDGAVDASGTIATPAIAGELTLAGGSYSSSLLPSGIAGARARLDLARSSARLSGVHATLGGGSLDGSLDATYGDLRDARSTLAFDGSFSAQHATINAANIAHGTLDGTLTAHKARGDIPQLAGTLTFSSTRISYAALIPHTTAPATTPVPPTVAFDLAIEAGNDVRVQGPGVDVGARGRVVLGGTLAAPALDGRITSTDGQLSFYRTFVLHQGDIAFHPADGLIPDVDATATTQIADPPTDILLHVTGPATHLDLQLASNPSYDRGQILGLLVNAQALGAVPGIAATQNAGTGISAGTIAGDVLGQEFTQNLLQPLGSQLGSSLGLQDLALGYDFGTGVSAGARKQLGKNLYATFNQTFGVDQRQSVALNFDLPRRGTIAATFFNAGNQAPSLLTTQQLFAPVDPTNFTLEALQPPPGIAGVVLTYQRKF